MTSLHPPSMIYLFWTCRDKAEAKKVIFSLLEKRLIACASILSEVESFYRWEGKIEENQEVKVILKTVCNLYAAVQNHIIAHCSYEVPEITQIPVADVNPGYLSWIIKETSPPLTRETC